MLHRLPITILWPGAQCLLRNYWLTAPPAVSVPLGLCVIIPCNFTYEQRHADRDAPLYGYWFEAESVYTGAPVATNNPRKTVQSYTRNRFTLSEHLDQGDCSLTIKNARKTDRKQYIFRVEREPRAKFTYSGQLYLDSLALFLELGKPEIQIPRELRAGQPVNITCTAPASCPPMSPNMTWEGISEASTSGISAMLPSGSDIYRTVFNFRLSAADHGKLLTCSVSYGKGPEATQTAEIVLLNVHCLAVVLSLRGGFPVWMPSLGPRGTPLPMTLWSDGGLRRHRGALCSKPLPSRTGNSWVECGLVQSRLCFPSLPFRLRCSCALPTGRQDLAPAWKQLACLGCPSRSRGRRHLAKRAPELPERAGLAEPLPPQDAPLLLPWLCRAAAGEAESQAQRPFPLGSSTARLVQGGTRKQQPSSSGGSKGGGGGRRESGGTGEECRGWPCARKKGRERCRDEAPPPHLLLNPTGGDC
uniref:Ig-like domain-containing protein n=1 Tax=Varanus komodoensis TaxID=61221 RepID=A0A8D2J5D8_VARKO